MCVALSFLFGYLLSTRCVYPQIGRAFEAPIGHKTLLCGHMVLLTPFVAYFLKNNYSRRQIILKNLRVWEWSLISVPIGVYFGLIEVGTRLGKSGVQEWRKTIAKGGPDDQQCFYSVWCDDVSASGQRRMGLREGPDSMLHPVKCHRTRSIMIWGSLDLSVVDQTLEGYVRSSLPVRPVTEVQA